jgi:ribose/xylose/arabinose/galactoside ABC-type transport system permease subunit
MAEPIRYGGSIVGAGQGYLLPALAACYLGSTMFSPGRVNIAGTFVGTVFMILISNFMQLLSIVYYYTPLVQGIALIIAVGISVIKNKGEIQQVKV